MQKRSPKFELHPLDLKKTARDFLIFAAACGIPALTIMTDAYIKGEVINTELIWITFATPFIAGLFAGINRWLNHFQDGEDV